jgi:hypothetical protein
MIERLLCWLFDWNRNRRGDELEDDERTARARADLNEARFRLELVDRNLSVIERRR